MELLAFLAKWPRRHDTPWHFPRTDIACPLSRAKKCTLSRAREMSRRARSLGSSLLKRNVKLVSTRLRAALAKELLDNLPILGRRRAHSDVLIGCRSDFPTIAAQMRVLQESEALV